MMPEIWEYCLTYGHEYHPGDTECRACGRPKNAAVALGSIKSERKAKAVALREQLRTWSRFHVWIGKPHINTYIRSYWTMEEANKEVARLNQQLEQDGKL